jgi:hypothetical protein
MKKNGGEKSGATVPLSSPIYLKTAQNKTIFHVESSSAFTGRISMKKVLSEVYIVTDLCS